MRVHARLDSFDVEREFGPWVRRVAANLCLNRLEAQKPVGELDEERDADPAQSPEAALEVRERSEQIRAALAPLPPRWRAVIELRHYQELSYEEIGRELGLPISDVKSHLFRARIQTHLDSCDDCAARLATLQTLFAELDSLPELTFTTPLAARVLLDLKRTPRLPRWLPLTSLLQTAVAVVAIIVAAPLVTNLLPAIETPSSAELLAQLQAQWISWSELLSSFRLPTMPQFPSFEISSLMLSLALAGVAMLWLVGNGLLLKNQIK